MTVLADAPHEAAESLESIARAVRGTVVRMSHEAKSAHLGSSLSVVDILGAAYWGALRLEPQALDAPDRELLILSKGHAASALHAVLARWGAFSPRLLDTYARAGGQLGEHPSPSTPGVEAATGSPSHGLSLRVGKALAGRIRTHRRRVYAVASD